MKGGSSDLFAIFVPNSPKRHVFKEMKEVKKFLDSPLGKKEGTRFKKCADDAELNVFFEVQKKEEESPTRATLPSTSAAAEPVSPYRSLPTARFTEFRRAIEQKDNAKFEELLKESPRFFLNTNNDSPAILQEGYRFNTMHIACRTSNFYVAKRCIELATQLPWLTHIYGTESCMEERSEFLLDGLLNTPDLIENNTPLHYACKFGQPDIVRLLLSFSTCKRHPKNKYNEKPMQMLCRRFKGTPAEKKCISEEIDAIFRRGLSSHRNLSTPKQQSSLVNEDDASPISHNTDSEPLTVDRNGSGLLQKEHCSVGRHAHLDSDSCLWGNLGELSLHRNLSTPRQQSSLVNEDGASPISHNTDSEPLTVDCNGSGLLQKEHCSVGRHARLDSDSCLWGNLGELSSHRNLSTPKQQSSLVDEGDASPISHNTDSEPLTVDRNRSGLLQKEHCSVGRHARLDSDLCLWGNLGGKLFFPPHTKDPDWRPSLSTIIRLLFSIRMASSFCSYISDCDEVFNYWEPLHFLLFGRGFQTWEYSPVYAIRSWFYIYIHYIPAQILFVLFSLSKVAYFHVLRFLIGFVSIMADVCLCESICKRLGNMIGLLYIVFSMFSVGTFGASCAFLPSTFSMILNTFAMAAYLQEQWFYSVLCTCISATVGWPFSAVLGLPIFLEMVVVRNLALKFIKHSLLSAAIVLPTLYFVDSYYYGKSVLAPLNIVLYNIFTNHGPELYGVEPASFYAKNLLLNWNIVLGFAAISMPASFYVFVFKGSSTLNDNRKPLLKKADFSLYFWYRYLPIFFIFLSASLWLTIFTAQAHKEERFLFPIFSLISMLGAVGLDAVLRMSNRLSFVGMAALGVFITASLSRGYALHRNYSAAMDSYRALNDYFAVHQHELDFSEMRDPIRICVGKEWHRFPSSFFLPELLIDKRGRKRYVELHFIESEFRGLLPKHFAQGSVPNVTRFTPLSMNDLNREELSHYVRVETCDYLVDLVTGRTASREPDFSNMKDKFSVLIEKPFLIAQDSHPIFRAFYVPFTYQKLYFGRYVVLERKRK